MKMQEIENFEDLQKFCSCTCNDYQELDLSASTFLTPTPSPSGLVNTSPMLKFTRKNFSGSIKIAVLTSPMLFMKLFNITGFIYSYHTPIGVICNNKVFVLSAKPKIRLSNTTDKIIRILNKRFYPLDILTLKVIINEFNLESERI